MKEVIAKIDNPLSDLISNEIYDLLDSQGLIDEKAVRDYQIRKRFKLLRSTKVSAGELTKKLLEITRSVRGSNC